ncbi:MAG: hypothetical protein IJ658_07750 [Kiritimatiellae bacterium]|nr:hypothetical protein [Kiritimatiellia bacterium]
MRSLIARAPAAEVVRRLVVVAACCAVGEAAEAVTIDVPAGTRTNVTEVFTGETAVAVNTGATGGTVRLSPHSTHTGGTTLGSGTLDVQQESQLGGSLTFHGGNFRYSGPAGAVWTTAVTNAATTTAQNWRIDSDLTMAGDMWSTDGLFVKTGPATLTLAAPFYLGAETSNSGSRATLINLSDDRAPTTGLSGATIAEGTVVVNTPYDTAVTNKFSACSNASIVGVRTTNAVNEAALVVSNGITRTHAALVVGAGYGNGNGSSLVKGRLEVAGGTLMVGNTAANILYAGVNNYPDEMRVESVVDVSSAQRLYSRGTTRRTTRTHIPPRSSTAAARSTRTTATSLPPTARRTPPSQTTLSSPAAVQTWIARTSATTRKTGARPRTCASRTAGASTCATSSTPPKGRSTSCSTAPYGTIGATAPRRRTSPLP